MAKAVRVGMIGCGAIAARLHVPDLHHSPDAELVAFCDVTRAAAEALAARFAPDAVLYRDYTDLLADANVDAVVITLPNHLHAEATIAAAKAGKQVLVEKPMATSLEEGRKMVAAAKKAGTLLLVNQSQRLAPEHRKAKEVLDSGILGKVLHVTAMFGHGGPEEWSPQGKWFFDRKRARFGAMADLGVHKADLVRYLTSKEVGEITGFYERLEKKGASVEDNFVSAVKFQDGTLGTLCASWTAKGSGVDYTIFHCSNGTFYVKLFPDAPLVAELVNPECRIVFEPTYPENVYPESWGMDVGGAFARACLGTEPPFCTGEDALKSLEIILSAERSADTGKTVKLKH